MDAWLGVCVALGYFQGDLEPTFNLMVLGSALLQRRLDGRNNAVKKLLEELQNQMNNVNMALTCVNV
jgi:hypothetical protein